MAATSSRLTSLPAEMVERIAELAEPQDLFALRRTCRFIEKSTKRTFAKVHFTEHSVSFMGKHLRRAMDIADHPEFGKAITTLRICIDVVKDTRDSLPFAARPSRKLNQKSRRGPRQTVHQEHTESHLLFQLLGKLVKLNITSIVIFDRWVASGRSDPLSAEVGRNLVVPSPHDTVNLSLILDALRSSRPSIKSLSTECSQLNLSAHCRIIHQELLMSKITNLSLRIAHSGSEMFVVHAAEELAQALAKVPQLEHLDIAVEPRVRTSHRPVDYSMDDYSIAIWLFKQNFPALKTFHMSGAHVNLDELGGFLQKAAAASGLESFSCEDLEFETSGERTNEEVQAALNDVVDIEVSCVDCSGYRYH